MENTKTGYAYGNGVETPILFDATDSQIDFTVVVYNFPRVDVKIIARPFVTVNGTTYYGEPIAYSYNEAGVPVAE